MVATVGALYAMVAGLSGVAGAQAPSSGTIQFLDSGALEIRVKDITAGSDVARVEVINTSSDTPLVATLYLSSSLSGSLVIDDPTLFVEPTSTADVALKGGSDPQPSVGEIVLVGDGISDRREVRVTQSTRFLADMKGYFALAGAILLAVVLFVIALTRRGKLKSVASWSPPSGDRRSDAPSAEDLLQRRPFAHALATIAKSSTPPVVIGVLGEWGTGKSTVLNQIREELDKETSISQVWFDPWLHQADEQPILALLHNTVEQLGLDGRRQLRRRLQVISSTLGATAYRLATRGSLDDVVKSIEKYDRANFQERAQAARIRGHFENLIAEVLRARQADLLVIYVDDLDRCDPDKILGLLEALKLYMSLPSCVFYVAIAPEVIKVGIAAKYKDLEVTEHAYLDKVIQLPFELPRPSRFAVDDYIKAILPEAFDVVRPMLTDTLSHNPRGIKRFINVLLVHDVLAETTIEKNIYHSEVLTGVLVLQSYAPDVYVKLSTNPGLLQSIADDLAEGSPEPSQNGEPLSEDTAASSILADLSPIAITVVSHLIRLGADLEDVSPYYYLTESTGATSVPPEPGIPASDYITLARMVEEAQQARSTVRFPSADLRACDLKAWRLRGADLTDARLERSDLSRSILTGASLRGAQLQHADLSFARLDDADLRDADLVGADLSFASLAGCDLRGANLDGADLNGAETAGALTDDPSLASASRDSANSPTSEDRGALLDSLTFPAWLDESSYQLEPRASIARTSGPEDLRPPDILDLPGRSVLVTGSPGVGKTTLMWRIASAAKHRVRTGQSEDVPIFFSCGSWPSGMSLEQWIVQEASSRGRVTSLAVHRLVRAGQVLVLLDGIDELPLGEGGQFAREVAVLLSHRQARVVVSSRNIGRLPEFRVDNIVEVHGYTKSDVLGWLHSRGVQDDQLATIQANAPFWELVTSTPLMARAFADLATSGSLDFGEIGAQPANGSELIVSWITLRLRDVPYARFRAPMHRSDFATEGRVGPEADLVLAALTRLAELGRRNLARAFAPNDSDVREALRELNIRGSGVSAVLEAGAHAGVLHSVGILDKHAGERYQFAHLAMPEALLEVAQQVAGLEQSTH